MILIGYIIRIIVSIVSQGPTAQFEGAHCPTNHEAMGLSHIAKKNIGCKSIQRYNPFGWMPNSGLVTIGVGPYFTVYSDG